ncbi:LysR substrate-binding domain-containing protein [Bordetella sp. BOR01]|uniref:LysR substrate-binding domain-containing protein n=1 Tax=Bordetella sp. BOR01 TaxID=2854779 RepID=UPI00210226EC|nr:LysR substrate-binding domain-containing protein [Bordetella sp. BOR01]
MGADKGPMNVRALEAFRAVMRTGSMTAAARIIHTTQPNISRLVSILEAELALKLFAREGNKLHVTDEGVAFFKEVEQHYAGLSALKDAARTIKQLGGGRLHIATAPALSHGFLANVVAEFVKRHPRVTLSIRTCNSYMVEQLVNSQLCDLGLAAFIGHVTEPGLESERIASIRGVCLLHRDHPLAAREVIHARDLEGEAFVSIARQNGSREHVDSLFEQVKVTRKIEVEAENASTICHLVAQGLGVSVLNAVIAGDFLCHGLVVKEFQPAIHFPITLLRSSHRPRSLLVAAFIDCLGAVLKSRFEETEPATFG